MDGLRSSFLFLTPFLVTATFPCWPLCKSSLKNMWWLQHCREQQVFQPAFLGGLWAGGFPSRPKSLSFTPLSSPNNIQVPRTVQTPHVCQSLSSLAERPGAGSQARQWGLCLCQEGPSVDSCRLSLCTRAPLWAGLQYSVCTCLSLHYLWCDLQFISILL